MHAPELMDQARAALEPVSRLASRAAGSDLEACRPHLEEAVRWLEAAAAALRAEPGRGDPAAAQALAQFRTELQRAQGLHEHAGILAGGLLRILARHAGAGYRPRAGETLPAVLPRGRRVSVEA
jgi:hypothetical protein